MVRLKPVPVSRPAEALAASLQERILSGAIAEGRMLNEQELVDLSGLSRSSVREALRSLELRGLVETRRGRNGGWLARSPGVSTVAESLDLYMRGGAADVAKMIEIVEIIEPGLAALAARRRSETDLVAIREALAAMDAAEDPERFVELNRDWHLALVRASGNEVLIAVYESLGPALLHPRLEGFADAEIRRQVRHAARRIFEAVEAGDAETARRRMAGHATAYREAVEARLKD